MSYRKVKFTNYIDRDYEYIVICLNSEEILVIMKAKDFKFGIYIYYSVYFKYLLESLRLLEMSNTLCIYLLNFKSNKALA